MITRVKLIARPKRFIRLVTGFRVKFRMIVLNRYFISFVLFCYFINLCFLLIFSHLNPPSEDFQLIKTFKVVLKELKSINRKGHKGIFLFSLISHSPFLPVLFFSHTSRLTSQTSLFISQCLHPDTLRSR